MVNCIIISIFELNYSGFVSFRMDNSQANTIAESTDEAQDSSGMDTVVKSSDCDLVQDPLRGAAVGEVEEKDASRQQEGNFQDTNKEVSSDVSGKEMRNESENLAKEEVEEETSSDMDVHVDASNQQEEVSSELRAVDADEDIPEEDREKVSGACEETKTVSQESDGESESSKQQDDIETESISAQVDESAAVNQEQNEEVQSNESPTQPMISVDNEKEGLTLEVASQERDSATLEVTSPEKEESITPDEDINGEAKMECSGEDNEQILPREPEAMEIELNDQNLEQEKSPDEQVNKAGESELKEKSCEMSSSEGDQLADMAVDTIPTPMMEGVEAVVESASKSDVIEELATESTALHYPPSSTSSSTDLPLVSPPKAIPSLPNTATSPTVTTSLTLIDSNASTPPECTPLPPCNNATFQLPNTATSPPNAPPTIATSPQTPTSPLTAATCPNTTTFVTTSTSSKNIISVSPETCTSHENNTPPNIAASSHDTTSAESITSETASSPKAVTPLNAVTCTSLITSTSPEVATSQLPIATTSPQALTFTTSQQLSPPPNIKSPTTETVTPTTPVHSPNTLSVDTTTNDEHTLKEEPLKQQEIKVHTLPPQPPPQEIQPSFLLTCGQAIRESQSGTDDKDTELSDASGVIMSNNQTDLNDNAADVGVKIEEKMDEGMRERAVENREEEQKEDLEVTSVRHGDLEITPTSSADGGGTSDAIQDESMEVDNETETTSTVSDKQLPEATSVVDMPEQLPSTVDTAVLPSTALPKTIDTAVLPSTALPKTIDTAVLPSTVDESLPKTIDTAVLPSTVDESLPKIVDTAVLPSTVDESLRKTVDTAVLPSTVDESLPKTIDTAVLPSTVDESLPKTVDTASTVDEPLPKTVDTAVLPSAVDESLPKTVDTAVLPSAVDESLPKTVDTAVLPSTVDVQNTKAEGDALEVDKEDKDENPKLASVGVDESTSSSSFRETAGEKVLHSSPQRRASDSSSPAIIVPTSLQTVTHPQRRRTLSDSSTSSSCFINGRSDSLLQAQTGSTIAHEATQTPPSSHTVMSSLKSTVPSAASIGTSTKPTQTVFAHQKHVTVTTESTDTPSRIPSPSNKLSSIAQTLPLQLSHKSAVASSTHPALLSSSLSTAVQKSTSTSDLASVGTATHHQPSSLPTPPYQGAYQPVIQVTPSGPVVTLIPTGQLKIASQQLSQATAAEKNKTIVISPSSVSDPTAKMGKSTAAEKRNSAGVLPVTLRASGASFLPSFPVPKPQTLESIHIVRCHLEESKVHENSSQTEPTIAGSNREHQTSQIKPIKQPPPDLKSTAKSQSMVTPATRVPVVQRVISTETVEDKSKEAAGTEHSDGEPIVKMAEKLMVQKAEILGACELFL